jgi:hypothetical protein
MKTVPETQRRAPTKNRLDRSHSPALPAASA